MTTSKDLSTLLFVIPFAVGVTGQARGADLKGRVALPSDSTPAVVFLVGVSGGTMPTRDTTITHLPGGAFEPAVSVGFVGNDFVFKNEDDTLHTTHLQIHLAYHEKASGRPLKNGATVYNIALPLEGMEVHRPIKEYQHFSSDTGYISVRCNPHPDEQAALLVFDHPYAAVTGADGTFDIPGVPAGTHDVWVWHDGQASKWRSVEVSGTTEIAVEVPSP